MEERCGTHMARRGKDGGVDEEGLWALVAADITPLKGRKAPAPPLSPTGTVKAAPRTAAARAAPVRTPVMTAPQGRDMDRRTEQKLVRGQMEIEATIDLHGHGQAAAHDAFLRFLSEARRRGYRCVLAITGKGKDGRGILRARIQEWVNEAPLKDFVLKAVPARQRDGGHGAFYIFLRRQR